MLLCRVHLLKARCASRLPGSTLVNMEDERYTGTTFTVQQEDHTLANALRFFLNKNPQVTFSGYSIPHPTEDAVNIRVQTTGEVTAAEALTASCEECSKVSQHIRGVFDNAIEQYQQQNPDWDQQPGA